MTVRTPPDELPEYDSVVPAPNAIFFRSMWSDLDKIPFPVKLNISPVNVEELSRTSVPVVPLNLIEPPSAKPNSSVAPALIVAGSTVSIVTFSPRERRSWS